MNTRIRILHFELKTPLSSLHFLSLSSLISKEPLDTEREIEKEQERDEERDEERETVESEQIEDGYEHRDDGFSIFRRQIGDSGLD